MGAAMLSAAPTLIVTERCRARDRLGRWVDTPAPDPLIDVLVGQVRSGPCVLSGGEPTLRGDLPAIVSALVAVGASPWLDTDGAALGTAAAWAPLLRAGLAGVRLRVHALVAEAHDYLEGQPGALRRSIRAFKQASALGVPIELETALTRPTAPGLAQLAVQLRELGLRPTRWALRWPHLADPQAAAAVAVQPRPGLMEPSLLSAIDEAMSVGWPVVLIDVPRCAAPGTPAERFAASPVAHGARPRCPGCPGAACVGFSPAWVERFGDAELRSEGVGPAPSPPAPAARAPADPPPARMGRAPATRLRAVRQVARWPTFDGDPSLTSPACPAPALPRLALRGPSRALRQALVTIAQELPQRVILGPIEPVDRADALELVREALRLGVPEVEVEAQPAPLLAAPDRVLVGLRGLRRWTWPLPADTAPPSAAGLDALQRLARLGGAAVGLAATHLAQGRPDPLPSAIEWRALAAGD